MTPHAEDAEFEFLYGGAEAAVGLRATKVQTPLRLARLWHPVCSACRHPLRWVRGKGANGMTCNRAGCSARHRLVEATSQRYPLSRSIQDALAVFGGNGAGKTFLVAQLALAVAIGRDNPDVARWVKANGVAPELIPPKGGLVIFSSLTSNLSKLTARPAVKRFAPIGSSWRNEEGQGEAECVPFGRCGDGKIVFKSNDQTADKFQGAACALVILDEEHDKAVYDEVMARTDRFRWEGRSGYVVLSMTPLKGFTWVFDTFVDPETRDEGTRAAWIWGENNPHLDQVARARKLRRKSLSAAMRSARDRGVFGSAEGLIYGDYWRPDVHVIPAFKIPRDWYWVESIDFGDRNPFSYGLHAYDPSTDTLYRVAEHYRAGWNIAKHAERIKELRAEHGVNLRRLFTVSDPAQKGQRRSLDELCGIPNDRAKKDVLAGIGELQARLDFDADTEPGFYVFDTCVAFVKEIMSYKWEKKPRSKRDEPEQPLKKDDHAMDDARYACMAVRYQVAFAA